MKKEHIYRTLQVTFILIFVLFLGTPSMTHGEPSQATTLSLLNLPVSSTPLLRIHPDNPRFFSDADGKAIYLAGAHLWQNLQHYGSSELQSGDCGGHPCGDEEWDFLRSRGLNFTRGWHWEQESNGPGPRDLQYSPIPFQKVGGLYDLYQYNDTYFQHLRSRVASAQEKGLYISIMLFEGFSVQARGYNNPWPGHPFHPNNNSTFSFDPDSDGDGEGEEIHTLARAEVTAVQKAYIEEVIHQLNEYDNVIWEICNECGDSDTNAATAIALADTFAWMEEMVNHIKFVENRDYPQRKHLVWLSATYRHLAADINDLLLNSSADVVSLRGGRLWNDVPRLHMDPPPYLAETGKAIILDSDHIYNPICVRWGSSGVWCDTGWAWKSFTRGYNPVLMDAVRTLFPVALNQNDTDGDGIVDDDPPGRVEAERQALGQTAYYANEVVADLAAMEPHGALSETGYCLAHPGFEYLVFHPDSSADFWVELEAGNYTYEWFDTNSGQVTGSGSVQRATLGQEIFSPGGENRVLHVLRAPEPLNISGPDDSTVFEGGSASFSVLVSGGESPIQYLWEYSSSETGPFQPISGPEFSTVDTPTGSTLTIGQVTASHEGWYRCVVDDSASQSVTSTSGALNVNPATCGTPPIAHPDSIEVIYGGPTAQIADEFILANDEGANLSQPNDAVDWVVTSPDGTLTPKIAGGWTYQTPAEYQPFDSFEYKVISAGDEACFDVGTVNITILPPPCEAPVAQADSIVVVHGGATVQITDEFILTNDEGTALSLPSDAADWVVTSPDGTLTPQVAGGWTYQAPTDYQSFDSFEYKVISAGDETCFDVGTVNITIESPTNAIYIDGFEAPSLSAWDLQTTAGNGTLTLDTGYPMVGNSQLAAVVVAGSSDQAYVSNLSPASESFYRARFHFDPESAKMVDGNQHQIFVARDDSPSKNVVMLQHRKSGGQHEIQARTRHNDLSWLKTAWIPISGTTQLEVVWWNDPHAGGLKFLIDGTLQATLEDIENNQFQIDSIRLGILSGVDTGTNGPFFFDQFESYSAPLYLADDFESPDAPREEWLEVVGCPQLETQIPISGLQSMKFQMDPSTGLEDCQQRVEPQLICGNFQASDTVNVIKSVDLQNLELTPGTAFYMVNLVNRTDKDRRAITVWIGRDAQQTWVSLEAMVDGEQVVSSPRHSIDNFLQMRMVDVRLTWNRSGGSQALGGATLELIGTSNTLSISLPGLENSTFSPDYVEVGLGTDLPSGAGEFLIDDFELQAMTSTAPPNL